MHTLFNSTAGYAVQAALFLAQQEERATAARMADALQLPRNYLSKVLHLMAHVGVLESVRGRHGGFRLARAADAITLADVTRPFVADTDAPVWWQEASGQPDSFLKNTTLQMLVDAQRRETINGGSNVIKRRTE